MKIVITQLPRWNNFMYFLLGFYKLEEEKIIKVNFKSDIIVNMATKINNDFISKVLKKIYNKFLKKSKKYNLKGYLVLDNGEKRKFVIDCADSPFLFNAKDLEECDIYFKIQCPKELNSNGFKLTPKTVIPWTDHTKKGGVYEGARLICINFEKNKDKIRPLMMGTRKLANGISYSLLKKRL